MFVFNDDLLQTVAVTVRTDIENIKGQLDNWSRSDSADLQVLAPVADGLQMLGNTLDMISKEVLSNTVFEHELSVRELLAGKDDDVDSMFSAISNTLLAVEDVLYDVAVKSAGNVALKKGIEAVHG